MVDLVSIGGLKGMTLICRVHVLMVGHLSSLQSMQFFPRINLTYRNCVLFSGTTYLFIPTLNVYTNGTKEAGRTKKMS